jgi:hypothetical protein
MMPKFNDDFERREWFGREGLKHLKELFPNTFKWDINFTTGKYDDYDAFWFIIDENQSIKRRVWVEIKWRDRSFDDYILEVKKLNQLKKLRNSMFLSKDDVTFIYINFTPNGTFMWDITNMEDSGDTLVANKATSDSRKNKINKKIIYLPEGKRFDYVINETQIIRDNQICDLLDETKKTIKKGLEEIFNLK